MLLHVHPLPQPHPWPGRAWPPARPEGCLLAGVALVATNSSRASAFAACCLAVLDCLVPGALGQTHGTPRTHGPPLDIDVVYDDRILYRVAQARTFATRAEYTTVSPKQFTDLDYFYSAWSVRRRGGRAGRPWHI